MPSVIVIGGGAIGATVTYRLAAAGVEVTLLDAGMPGGGTTSATFAMSIASRKTPRTHYDLAIAGMAEHRRLAAELGLNEATDWVHPSPAYEWATTDHDRDLIDARVARLRRWGHPVEWATGADLRDCEPRLVGPADDARVVVYTDEHWYDPDRMTRLIVDAAVRLGATLRAGARVSAITETSTGVSVRVGDDNLCADRVVLCAGPEANEVAQLAGLDLPVRRVPGLVVRSAPVPAGSLNGIVLLPDVNLRPGPEGSVLAHSYTTEADLPSSVDDLLQSTWTQRIAAYATDLLPVFGAAGIASARIGIRPVPADGMPIAGWLSGNRIYAVAAHSGVNFAPALARLAVPEIVDSGTSGLLDSFRPGRASLAAGSSLDESTREMSRILDGSEDAVPAASI